MRLCASMCLSIVCVCMCTCPQAHDLITFISGVVDVCDDAAWMSRASTARSLKSLAAFAASKFDICDQIMHAKLLVSVAKHVPCVHGVAPVGFVHAYALRETVAALCAGVV